jgi:hypothetical protein
MSLRAPPAFAIRWEDPSMRRIILAGVVATLALSMLAAPVAAAAPAPSGPSDATDEFDAGVVCSFPVRLEGWSNEKVRFDERTVVTGNALTRVTRLGGGSGESLLIRTGGRVVITEPGDGTSRLRAAGRTLFFFFPGDQNPTGEGNGLFLVSGRVAQTLDLSDDVVTRFAYRGTIRDLCAELS